MAAYTYPGGQNGQCLMVDNINFLFDSAQTTLENGINIVKLQYANSLTDIDHDYMVVDVMTDSSGYNNTVCTADTTSTKYGGNDLTGYYGNYCVETINGYCIGFTGSSGGYACYELGDYFGFLRSNTYSASGTFCWCACDNSLNPLDDNNYICFDAICHICITAQYAPCFCCAYATGITCLTGTSIDGCVDCCICLFGYTEFNSYGTCNCNWTVCNSYELCKSSSNCWDLYRNGTCLCQISKSCWDDAFCFFSCFSTSYTGPVLRCATTRAGFCICDIKSLNTSKQIVTVETQYSTPISTAYLTTEQTGIGSVVYNVIDATTSTCIACNLEPNVLNTLTCCVCCHIYEIVQCSDGVSCIKSYALAAGQA